MYKANKIKGGGGGNVVEGGTPPRLPLPPITRLTEVAQNHFLCLFEGLNDVLKLAEGIIR